MGFEEVPATITIEWDHYKGFNNMMKDLGLKPTVYNHYHRANIRDIVGNIITFLYYEMVIPTHVMIEKIE